jgi:hypothetical protein
MKMVWDIIPVVLVNIITGSAGAVRPKRLHDFCLKSGHFGVKSALFGAKSGQNQGFDVTDSSTVQKCKFLINSELSALGVSKSGQYGVGGVGVRWISGEETGKMSQGTGNREQKAQRLRSLFIYLLCAREG